MTYFGPFNAPYRDRFVSKTMSTCTKHLINVSDAFSAYILKRSLYGEFI